MITSKRYRIYGESPESEPHEWTGCGWADAGHGKLFSDVESWLIERKMNRATLSEGWIVWRVEEGERVQV